MLTAEENRALTESGPNTSMGRLLRRFWQPALLIEELAERDGNPKIVRILGEELLAFRDSEGRVGLIDPVCPHRGANLLFGRNEACGLRCAYHGWKFDTSGRCIDMPTSFPDVAAKDQMRITAYPTAELGDTIWTYMGPSDKRPPLPRLEWTLVPPSHRYVSKKWQDCNWAQCVEGAIDTAHFSFAHMTFDKGANEPLDLARHLTNPLARMKFEHVRWIADDPRPIYKVAVHDAGLVLAGARRADGDNLYWRIAQFLMPNHAYAPNAFDGDVYSGQTFVPVTDTTCWIYTYAWHPGRPLTADERGTYRRGNGVHAAVDENYVPLRNKANSYLIDRGQQRTKSYMGIQGVSEQDACLQDSQGPIADRTREHLGPTDLGILHFRRAVLNAAQALAKGAEPKAASLPGAYTVRGGAQIAHRERDLPAVMTERFGRPDGHVGALYDDAELAHETRP
jgi:phthalate 4,5-dioxygenase